MALSHAQAFIIQARSDYQVYVKLSSETSLPECHWLHYLQMCCEKLAKADRLKSEPGKFEDVVKSHKSFSSVIRLLYKGYLHQKYGPNVSNQSWKVNRAANFAREIERLHPSIDRDNRQDNCEYPWIDSAHNVVAPAQFKFFVAIDLSDKPEGRKFLEFVQISIDRLAEELGV